MTKRVVGSPEYEAKILFNEHIDTSSYFDYFFDGASPPDGMTEEQYITELKKEFYKLEKEYYKN